VSLRKGSEAFLLLVAYDRSVDGGLGSQPNTRPLKSPGPSKQAQPQASPSAARQNRKELAVLPNPGEQVPRPLSRKLIGFDRSANKNGTMNFGVAPETSRHRAKKDGKSSVSVRGSLPSAGMQMNGAWV